MFKSRNDRAALSSAMDDYIRDHTPISCDDLVRAMEEQGFHCYPNMARKYLKESGLRVRNVGGRWLWGMWDDQSEQNGDVDEDDDGDDEDDDEDQHPDHESIKRVEAENSRLQAENNRLMVAMLKSARLKKSIKAMQEKLLVELADLIHATYGERESESENQESD